MNVELLFAKLRGSGIPPADLMLHTDKPTVSPAVADRMVAYVWGKAQANQKLTAWVMRRQVHYINGPGMDWPAWMDTYSACRDYACWEMKKSEYEVNQELKKGKV